MSTILGRDASGNGNNWTVNNLSITDQMLDSPTNNFATWNPLNVYSGARNYSEGNLRVINTSNAWRNTFGNQGMPSGKYYWEIYIDGTGYTDINIGITTDNWTRSGSGGAETTDAYTLYAPNDKTLSYTYSNSNNSGSGGAEAKGTTGTFGLGDITQIAYDADTGKLWYGKNGTWLFSGVPSTGTSPETTVDASDIGNMIPVVSTHWTSSGPLANFGQDSSFAGNKVAQGNTDSNDIGDFFYTPPTGFLALCTKNLPDVADGLWSGGNNQAFNTVTYAGNNSSSPPTQSITDVGFSTDLLWLKGRASGYDNILQDSLRGSTYQLYSDSTSIEVNDTDAVTSFDDYGFSLGGDITANNNNVAYVAWNWKAGGTPTVDNSASAGAVPTAGSVKIDGVNLGSALAGSIAATRLSANTKAGFSIVSWVGSTTAGNTVGHGLNQAPELIIKRSRDTTSQWVVGNTDIGWGKYLYLNQTAQAYSYTDFWNDESPSTTVFTNGSDAIASDNYIAYCFHSVDGYSKVGSYTGNGSSDGTFVHTGFKPAYVMFKRTNSTSNWNIRDNKRDPDNVVENYLLADDSGQEYPTTSNVMDFTSNGFKLKGTGSGTNANGSTYIFIAFAEHPFKYSTAR